MKKILLAYATVEGQTEKIAAAIRDQLAAAGADVTLLHVREAKETPEPDLPSFDLLVFGASVHMQKIEKEMAAFIERHQDIIRDKARSLFVVSMAAASNDPAERKKSLDVIRQSVRRQVPVEFEDEEMIAGALMYTKYNWLVRWIMKRISAKEGGSTDTTRDQEYTDWKQVAAYAARLAAQTG